MRVGPQSVGSKPFVHHLIGRVYRKGVRQKWVTGGLMLTAMVDMFSVLVIFLLQTFSTSPELLMANDIVLPEARTGAEIKDAPVLSVSSREIFLDQERLGETGEILANPKKLMAKLSYLRNEWMKAHPEESFKGEINVQAHAELPSTTVSQIMGLLPGQNFGSIQLIVVPGGGG